MNLNSFQGNWEMMDQGETWQIHNYEPNTNTDNDDEEEDDANILQELDAPKLEEPSSRLWGWMISLITFVASMRSQERFEEECDERDGYDQGIELNPIIDMSSKPHPKIPGYKQMKQGVLVDSGAGASVADGDDFPGCVRESSEGSRRGQKFMGPGTEVLMNRGQITVPIVTREAIASKLKFQDAKVRRPILAVKDSCKAIGAI